MESTKKVLSDILEKLDGNQAENAQNVLLRNLLKLGTDITLNGKSTTSLTGLLQCIISLKLNTFKENPILDFTNTESIQSIGEELLAILRNPETRSAGAGFTLLIAEALARQHGWLKIEQLATQILSELNDLLADTLILSFFGCLAVRSAELIASDGSGFYDEHACDFLSSAIETLEIVTLEYQQRSDWSEVYSKVTLGIKNLIIKLHLKSGSYGTSAELMTLLTRNVEKKCHAEILSLKMLSSDLEVLASSVFDVDTVLSQIRNCTDVVQQQFHRSMDRLAAAGEMRYCSNHAVTDFYERALWLSLKGCLDMLDTDVVPNCVDEFMMVTRETAVPGARETAVPGARETAVPETKEGSFREDREKVVGNLRGVVSLYPGDIPVSVLRNCQTLFEFLPSHTAAIEDLRTRVTVSRGLTDYDMLRHGLNLDVKNLRRA